VADARFEIRQLAGPAVVSDERDVQECLELHIRRHL
jgi:hypothetical protein